MMFWDSSAIVPLLVEEPSSHQLVEMAINEGELLVWWGTRVECTSAITRSERDGQMELGEVAAALERLEALSVTWHEVLPTDMVRRVAERLLRVHELRAADSLQLAAALVAADRDPRTLPLVTLDDRLRLAAQREGFRCPAI